MKKFALVAIATALIGFGHAPVSAQTDPEPIIPIPADRALECGESTGRIDVNPADGIQDSCTEFYVAPAVLPPPPAQVTTTTTILAQAPPQGLPRTGSGVSSILGLGAALLVGGGIVVVATRRRSTATAS